MENTERPADADNELYLLINDARFFLGFAIGSCKRHRRLAVIVFISVVALSIALLKILPPVFEVRARILAHPSGSLMEIRPFEGRASFPELIRSQENIGRVVKELNLVERSQRNRSLQGRVKDWVFLNLFNKESNTGDLYKGMVYYLTDKVHVWNEDNVITLSSNWKDAETAYLISERLVEHFLEDQFKQENTEYLVNIANAEKRLARAEEYLKEAENAYRKRYNLEDKPVSEPQVVHRRVHSPEPISQPVVNQAVEESVQEMERELSLKRREMEMLQRTYLQRVGEAKNRLAELQLTMGPQHPEVIKAERLVNILSTPPPSLEKLREEQEKISADIATARMKMTSPRPSSRRMRHQSPTPSTPPETRTETSENEDEAIFEEYMRARLARNTMAEELANARIQYEAAKSVLDYRYKVTLPPSLPKKPIKPDPKKILAAAVVGGLFLAIFLAIFFDIKSGKILESWQVSRLIRIPVLGEIEEQKKAVRLKGA